MEWQDVSKQNVPALSYAATKNVNTAAYAAEVLKMAFCWCCFLGSCLRLMSAVGALPPLGSSGR